MSQAIPASRSLFRRWQTSHLRYAIRLRFQDACRAWALFRGTLTEHQARGLLYELEGIAGSYGLERLDESCVLDLAHDLWGEDIAALPEMVHNACERVAQKWDSTGDTPDAAEEWALDIVRDYAAARGIALIETHVTGATMFDFSAWVDDHAAKIEAAIREAGRRGNASALSAWVVPSNRVEPGQPGYLHIGTEPPFFGADIVRLGPHGTALARCPYPHIRSLLWDAVRSYPIRPLPKTA